MKNCAAIVGNSSSGLIEAPTFAIPAVNLGRRQASRLRGENVIDTDFEHGAIRPSDRAGAEPANSGRGCAMPAILTATAIHRNALSMC